MILITTTSGTLPDSKKSDIWLITMSSQTAINLMCTSVKISAISSIGTFD